MTEREKQNEEIKQSLREVALGFQQSGINLQRAIERFCTYVDDTEALLKFHEKNTATMAEHIDQEMVIG